MHDEYGNSEKSGREDTSFGSGDWSSPTEVNKEKETESDPTSNTKMVT